MHFQETPRIGLGAAAAAAALIALLIVTVIWVISAWNMVGDITIGPHGWIALGLGTVFSLVIGCGLMALMFFSSRSGYDDVADPFRPKQEPRSRK